MILAALLLALIGAPLASDTVRDAAARLAAIRPAAIPVARAHAIPCEILANKLVLVPVVVNGTGPHLFLLDTGGASTILSAPLARRLRLTPAARQRIELVGGTARTVPIGRLAELRLGGERFLDLDVLWMDLERLRVVDPRIQGVIGQDLLLTRNFLLDYEGRRLMFDAAAPEATPGAHLGSASWAGERVSMDRADGRPLVRGVVDEGVVYEGGGGRDIDARRVERRFVIDSAATHVILFQGDEERAWRHSPARAGTTMTMSSHGGSQTIATTTLARLVFSSTVLRNLVAGLVPSDPALGRVEDGLLPASLFRAIYFDHSAGVVILNPTPRQDALSPDAGREGRLPGSQ